MERSNAALPNRTICGSASKSIAIIPIALMFQINDGAILFGYFNGAIDDSFKIAVLIDRSSFGKNSIIISYSSFKIMSTTKVWSAVFNGISITFWQADTSSPVAKSIKFGSYKLFLSKNVVLWNYY